MLKGGCFCGKVRYEAEGQPWHATACHCSICRRTSAAPFVAWFTVKPSAFRIVAGEPARFRSSEHATRTFCPSCGTPLTFEWSKQVIELSIGSFDRAAEIRPSIQMAVEHAMPWIGDLAALPTKDPEEEAVMQGYYASIVSNQHPDHDTDDWPPKT